MQTGRVASLNDTPNRISLAIYPLYGLITRPNGSACATLVGHSTRCLCFAFPSVECELIFPVNFVSSTRALCVLFDVESIVLTFPRTTSRSRVLYSLFDLSLSLSLSLPLSIPLSIPLSLSLSLSLSRRPEARVIQDSANLRSLSLPLPPKHCRCVYYNVGTELLLYILTSYL